MSLTSMMKRLFASIAVLLLVGLANGAQAEQGTWGTDPAVGANEVQVTLAISCPAASFVCSLIDGYWDQQVSTVTGSGTLDIDEGLDELRFETDGSEDLGSGPVAVYGRVNGSPLAFTLVPFAGVPELENLRVFGLLDTALAAPGLELIPAGDHVFTGSQDYGAIGNVIGDLELALSELIVPGETTSVAGTFSNLGDVDSDGFFEYEIQDYAASATAQQAAMIGGEPVTITVTADLTGNFSGELPGAPAVPGLGWVGRWLLVLSLGSALLLVGRNPRAANLRVAARK